MLALGIDDCECHCDCDGTGEVDIEAIALWEAAADIDGIGVTVHVVEIDGAALTEDIGVGVTVGATVVVACISCCCMSAIDESDPDAEIRISAHDQNSSGIASPPQSPMLFPDGISPTHVAPAGFPIRSMKSSRPLGMQLFAVAQYH